MISGARSRCSPQGLAVFAGKVRFLELRWALDFLRCDEFPVFLRGEKDHDASITDLLHTREELARAIAESSYIGYRMRDLIIVEFCDTKDEARIFRKYSSFIVGDRILPHTLMRSKNWISKSH